MGLSCLDFERMTLDQIAIMTCDKKLLKVRKYVTGTPQQLANMGYRKGSPNPNRSMVDVLREQIAREKKQCEQDEG